MQWSVMSQDIGKGANDIQCSLEHWNHGYCGLKPISPPNPPNPRKRESKAAMKDSSIAADFGLPCPVFIIVLETISPSYATACSQRNFSLRSYRSSSPSSSLSEASVACQTPFLIFALKPRPGGGKSVNERVYAIGEAANGNISYTYLLLQGERSAD